MMLIYRIYYRFHKKQQRRSIFIEIYNLQNDSSHKIKSKTTFTTNYNYMQRYRAVISKIKQTL